MPLRIVDGLSLDVLDSFFAGALDQDLQQLTTDDGRAGAQGNWIWNVEVSATHAGTPVAADDGRDGSIALLGTSDALAPTDFFVV